MSTLSFSYFLYNHYKYKTKLIKINQKINFVKFDDIQLIYIYIYMYTKCDVCVCSKSGTSKLIKYLSNEFN